MPSPGEAWTFSYQQPVVEPQGESRYWVQVLWELAERMGIQGDIYAAYNAIAQLEEPHRLDPSKTYTWEEVAVAPFSGFLGSAVMYEPGKILQAGGNHNNMPIASAATIDFH